MTKPAKQTFSSMKVFGLPSIHENTSIKFNSNGLVLSVGLNVEPHIAVLLNTNQHLSGFSGKVLKGHKMQCYKLAQAIPGNCINADSIINVQSDLLRRVQIDINIAKSFHYKQKAKSLEV